MQTENKLVIFDLDGVLIDSKDLHYRALNAALQKVGIQYVISIEEHLSTYDGLSTLEKLKILTQQKGLPTALYDQIWKDKQEASVNYIPSVPTNASIVNIITELRHRGWKIAVASNSIRKTVQVALTSMGILHHIDFVISNEDVSKPKPFPEMYWRCMISLKTLPKNTVIVEDSLIGREGALNSGAILYPVTDAYELTTDTFINFIDNLEIKETSMTWKNKKMNVVIPMAGLGSRFAAKGYTFPKPLIEVNNKPMIQLVVENLNIDAHYIFIVQKEHYEKYNLKQLLNLIAPGADIIQVNETTEGAACSTLLAKNFINNENPLLIANSDQFVEWNSSECLYAFSAESVDAGIITFDATHPKWSFVKLNDDGQVTEVAEKNPISNLATAGIYYWRRGEDYVKYAEQMIARNIRTNNEFYVCPVFNEAIQDGKNVRTKHISKMWGLGTPEDLEYFLKYHR